MYLVLFPVDSYLHKETFRASFTLGAYIFLGIVQMLYPIGGILADICCGRYKVIVSSILNIWCGFLFACTSGIIYAITKDAEYWAIVATTGIAVLAFIFGFSGFRSNVIQFSLDQMPDTSSEKISLFLHWLVWTEYVAELSMRLIVMLSVCHRVLRHEIVAFSSIAFFALSTALLLLLYCTHSSFQREKTSSNPYWNVWNVLKFTVQHDKPLGHRSAFTYSDDVKPHRIDFAKRIYGGPYQTEVVEDVKTFLRIVLMLLATAPVFALKIPTSYLFQLWCPICRD